jgi:hypothetical protein
MRAAITFGTVDFPEIDLDEFRLNTPNIEGGRLDILAIDPINPQVRQVLDELWPDAFAHTIYATMWTTPHIDRTVVGDITLGLVISGDHYLFTGNGRRVGDLVPGTVFALCNKKTHGAYARDKSNRIPMVFATCEPEVDVRDWPTFCASVDQKIRDRQARLT